MATKNSKNLITSYETPADAMLLEILVFVMDHAMLCYAENSLRGQQIDYRFKQIDCFDLGIIDADSGLSSLNFFKRFRISKKSKGKKKLKLFFYFYILIFKIFYNFQVRFYKEYA